MKSLLRSQALVPLLLFAFLLSACQTLSVEKRPELIQWRTLEVGKAEAAATGKPCLVDFFYSEECPRCAALLNGIYTDQSVADKINRNFIPIRVDLTRPLSKEERQVADEMNSGNECILLFLDPTGKVVKNHKGIAICTMDMMGKEEFVGYLDDALLNLKTAK